MLRFNEGTPIMSQDTRASVHKSYTDCYKMLGFVGGDWGFATNTTSVEGHKDAGVVMSAEPLPQKDRLLSVYILGWESIEVRFPVFFRLWEKLKSLHRSALLI